MTGHLICRLWFWRSLAQEWIEQPEEKITQKLGTFMAPPPSECHFSTLSANRLAIVIENFVVHSSYRKAKSGSFQRTHWSPCCSSRWWQCALFLFSFSLLYFISDLFIYSPVPEMAEKFNFVALSRGPFLSVPFTSFFSCRCCWQPHVCALVCAFLPLCPLLLLTVSFPLPLSPVSHQQHSNGVHSYRKHAHTHKHSLDLIKF